jgi:hypothetical protein
MRLAHLLTASLALLVGCRGADPAPAGSGADPEDPGAGGAGGSLPPVAIGGGKGGSAPGNKGEFGGGGGSSPASVPLDLGPAVAADPSPPPLSGGTLAVGVVGGVELAVVGDADDGSVSVVDLKARKILARLALEPGEQPGRVLIEGSRAHVLVRSGALLDVELGGAITSSRRALCPAPRGLAYDAVGDQLWVACQGGELQVLPASIGGVSQQIRLDPDLRDVVVSGDEILVSRLRSAEIIALDRSLTVKSTVKLPGFSGKGADFTASVAWRMAARPDGGAVVVHQRGATQDLQLTAASGYGAPSSCGSAGAVHAAFTLIGGGKATGSGVISGVMPLDIAASSKGYLSIAMGTPVEVKSFRADSAPPCETFPGGIAHPPVAIGFSGGAPAAAGAAASGGGSGWPSAMAAPAVKGQAISVAFASDGVPVVQGRLPAILQWGEVVISLGHEIVDDTGHRLFHMDSGAGVACASCHPEGGDDGRTWHFEGLGARRTQSLRGGLKGTEPFHWSGDMADFSHLVDEVFVHRMGGSQPSGAYAGALLDWMDHIPLPPVMSPGNTDASAAIERGRLLFESDEVGCAGCHSGPRLSNDASIDVGTGGPFQVPSLRRIALRGPFLHDGCAPTLAARFGPCGGGDKHGHTSQLAPGDIDDLVAYLGSL